jgi:PAS domain S-box-containing protein
MHQVTDDREAKLIARLVDRWTPKSRGPAALVLCLLVGLASTASVSLSSPYDSAADILIILFFFTAAWYFGVVGALAAWAAALGATYLIESVLGLAGSVNLANGVRGFASALLFGLLFQMRRSLVHKKAALEVSEARFRRLAQASIEGLVMVQKRRIIEVNDAFARLMRVRAEDLIGRDLASILAPEDADKIGTYAELADDKAEQGPIQARMRRADGTQFQGELIGRTMRSDRVPIHALGVRDITDRLKEEDTLRRGERLSSLGTLVAGVAHEINNPLAYIKGNIELVEFDVKDIAEAAPSARPAAERILGRTSVALEGLERIASITKSLRRVARSSDRVRAPEDVNRLVTSVLQIARGRIPPGVDVQVDLQATRPVMANGSEITQIVLNLLFNAADAVVAEGGLIHLRTFDKGPEVVVEVVDNGPGIPLASQPRLFTPFFTTKAHGTGLGLSVSRSIAKDHGGDLMFRSTPGEGAVFVLTLPATEADSS